MPTHIERLASTFTKTLHELALGVFQDGECYAFAIALSRSLGWHIVALMDGAVIRHALIRDPNGDFRDVRGKVAPAEIGSPFGLRPPLTFRDISELDLLAVRPVDETTIDEARQLAEIIWPDLPWHHSKAEKVKLFADRLEELSRQFGFWIVAPFPTARPLLFVAFGDEEGYTVCPTANLGGWTIERRLK